MAVSAPAGGPSPEAGGPPGVGGPPSGAPGSLPDASGSPGPNVLPILYIGIIKKAVPQ
ncbi:hypothetical protein [Paenibacillus sp. Z6-24]